MSSDEVVRGLQVPADDGVGDRSAVAVAVPDVPAGERVVPDELGEQRPGPAPSAAVGHGGEVFPELGEVSVFLRFPLPIAGGSLHGGHFGVLQPVPRVEPGTQEVSQNGLDSALRRQPGQMVGGYPQVLLGGQRGRAIVVPTSHCERGWQCRGRCRGRHIDHFNQPIKRSRRLFPDRDDPGPRYGRAGAAGWRSSPRLPRWGADAVQGEGSEE